jgi:hypothetical protein
MMVKVEVKEEELNDTGRCNGRKTSKGKVKVKVEVQLMVKLTF